MKTEFESPDISDKRETTRIKLYLDVFALQCLGRVRGAVRIARQPSKLKVMGSNPIGPATNPEIELLCN